MLELSLINKKFPSLPYQVDVKRVRQFARATGETSPVFFDLEIAKSLGHPSLLTPITFLAVIINENNYPLKYINALGVDPFKILHAGQHYKYHMQTYAGDTINMESKITDIYNKKSKTLQFIEITSLFKNQENILVAESTSLLVIRA
tara:strand:+ start:185 stop:625 length:441 start_codon:yes stop_codon:yes gene_type:complete